MAFGSPTGGLPQGLDLTFESNMLGSDDTVSLQEPKSLTAVDQENLQYTPLVAYINGRYNDSRQANPVLVVDEIDKASCDAQHNGNAPHEVVIAHAVIQPAADPHTDKTAQLVR